MPLTGEYVPSTSDWARKQAETFEASDGAQGEPTARQADHRPHHGRREDRRPAQDRPHARRARRTLRRRRLQGGAPEAPQWYWNLAEEPPRRAAGRRDKRDTSRASCRATSARSGGARIEVWPDYEKYQTKTDRLIAVFVLEPIEA